MLMMVCEGSTASSCGLAGTVMGLVSPDCSSLRSERERLVGILTLTLAPASPIFCASWNERILSSRVLPLMACLPKIGRAHVCTPVTNAHLVCRLLFEKKN